MIAEVGVKSRENLGFLVKKWCQLILPVCTGTDLDFCPNLELAVDNLHFMILFSKGS